eukprot:TRINITY_DN25221_c0_g1_i1.p1 TRINITY_DN25221_c0_g1~~TRINITY_DN25221_c0_g1_i1.p1  ORF type:complete len:300 (-),score=82.14 TRINITY_DN25221_c0_g1_i1:34-912(-)
MFFCCFIVFFFQAEDGIRDLVRSRGLGDVYKRQVHGYRNDLEKISEVPLFEVDAEILPRALLSRNSRSYELLFRALDRWGSKADFVWDLLCRLSTNEEVYEKIKEIDRKVVWEDTINTRSSFKLLYCLQIVLGLFKREELKEWKQQFVMKGGFSFLAALFTSKELSKSAQAMESYEKVTLIALIMVINAFTDVAKFILNKQLLEAYTEYLKITEPESDKPKKEEQEALCKLLQEKPSNVFFARGFNKKPSAVPVLALSEEQAAVVLGDVLDKEIWKKPVSYTHLTLPTSDLV